MKEVIRFELDQPAKSRGGDKYTAQISSEDRPFSIYVPQSLSRDNTLNRPRNELWVTIEEEDPRS